MLWPPQRTAISRPAVRANRTASTTSAVLSQRATTAGRRSIIAFHTDRASSYPGSPSCSHAVIGLTPLGQLVVSTTLTAKRYSDKVQLCEPNEAQFRGRRTARRAQPGRRRTAAPAAGERDPDADPRWTAAGRHGHAVHTRARAGSRAVPRRGRRGLSAAGRRGLPHQPRRRVHAGRRHRRRGAVRRQAVGEWSTPDRLDRKSVV